MTPDLQLALELADLADGITQPRFRAVDLRVDTKPDSSPVSDADTAVEAAVRRRLGQARPGDSILGEEEGTTGSGERRWLLDPIDGTRNYVRGIPIWATLIALEVAGRIEVGVVSAPALGRRWWAARGTGAFADSGPIRVSRVSRLADAYISTTDWTEFPPGAYEALARAAWTNRALGDFWSHVLVAEGSIDAAVEMPVEPWDLAAPQVIVEEAGGRLTDMQGKPRIDSGNVVTTNGLLHEEVLTALRL